MWCIRAVYTTMLTAEKLHSVSAKIDIFRLALTVYTERPEAIRIISARRATKAEKEEYYGYQDNT